jgi:hypothetical protein
VIATATEYENLSREELVEIVQQQFISYQQIKNELDQLKRLVFGPRHERFVPTTPQEQLALGLDIQAIGPPAPSVQTIEYTRTKKETSSNKIHTGSIQPT